MDFESLVEVNANKQVDKLFGDKDNKLKLITKLELLDDGTDEIRQEQEKMIKAIKKSNEIEAFYIKQQLHFTLDKDGNLIEVDNN